MVLKGGDPNTVEPAAPERAAPTRDSYEVVLESMAAEAWTIEEQPALGALQPDLLITSPGGKPFIVELKLEAKGSAHFGALAQLVRFQDEYRRLHPSQEVGAILLTNLRVDEPVESAATQLGVHIVSTGGSNEQVDQDVVNLLRHLA